MYTMLWDEINYLRRKHHVMQLKRYTMSLQSQGRQPCNYIEFIYGCIETITIILIQYDTFKPVWHENCIHCAQKYDSLRVNMNFAMFFRNVHVLKICFYVVWCSVLCFILHKHIFEGPGLWSHCASYWLKINS